MTDPIEAALLVQRSLTVAVSAYNALYFATYRLRNGRYRLGAVVLALINIAIAGESAAFWLLPWLLPWLLAESSRQVTAAGQLVAASLSLGSVSVKLLSGYSRSEMPANRSVTKAPVTATTFG